MAGVEYGAFYVSRTGDAPCQRPACQQLNETIRSLEQILTSRP